MEYIVSVEVCYIRLLYIYEFVRWDIIYEKVICRYDIKILFIFNYQNCICSIFYSMTDLLYKKKLFVCMYVYDMCVCIHTHKIKDIRIRDTTKKLLHNNY